MTVVYMIWVSKRRAIFLFLLELPCIVDAFKVLEWLLPSWECKQKSLVLRCGNRGGGGEIYGNVLKGK
jgi:hypothetical protein